MSAKLNVVAYGIALGLVWAVFVFLLSVFASFGYGRDLVSLLADFYIGYEATLIGSFIGASWAFVNLYILGASIAWLYNKFSSF